MKSVPDPHPWIFSLFIFNLSKCAFHKRSFDSKFGNSKAPNLYSFNCVPVPYHNNLSIQALWKRGKKEELLSPSGLLIRGAAAMLKIFCTPGGLGEKEPSTYGKLDKFVRKILTNSLAEDSKECLLLVNRILEVDMKEVQELATSEVLDSARKIALG